MNKLNTYYFEFYDEDAGISRDGYIKGLNEDICKSRLSKITGVPADQLNIQYMWSH